MQDKISWWEKVMFTTSALLICYGYLTIFYFAGRGGGYLYWGLFFSFLTILPRLARYYFHTLRPKMILAEKLSAEKRNQEDWELFRGILDYLISRLYRLVGSIITGIYSLLPGEFTYNLYSRYSKWHNQRLLKIALNYSGRGRKPFRVTVLDSDTIGSLVVLSVKYENMTKKNINQYIPRTLRRVVATDKNNIHIHDAGDNLVKFSSMWGKSRISLWRLSKNKPKNLMRLGS